MTIKEMYDALERLKKAYDFNEDETEIMTDDRLKSVKIRTIDKQTGKEIKYAIIASNPFFTKEDEWYETARFYRMICSMELNTWLLSANLISLDALTQYMHKHPERTNEDIKLLNELSYLIKNGKAKIMVEEKQ